MAETRPVISASRRTDIPGWYTPWFLDCIKRQGAVVTNPFNRKARKVALGPDAVHSIVFWSKNYGPFLDLGAHTRLKEMGYHLFFNFTVNPENDLLEPGIPDLASRLDQAETLSRTFSPDQIAWRFDPVCFYELAGQPLNTLAGFDTIARHLAGLGITRCITSFYDPYAKVGRRLRQMVSAGGPELRFTDPGRAKKTAVIQRMAGLLENLNIRLFLCCEKDLLDTLKEADNISPSACVDGHLLKRLFGGSPATARDQGQRKDKGCTCTRSVDIGSYDLHPCRHNCLFCYARTGTDIRKTT